MRDFDTMYGIYGEFQRHMERYWCLRWLQQEQDALSPTLSRTAGEGENEPLRELAVTAVVLRENLVKLAGIPLIFRAHSLPELPANTKVRLAITGIDLLDVDVRTRFIETIEEEAAEC
jgi:exoribonuclease-2